MSGIQRTTTAVRRQCSVGQVTLVFWITYRESGSFFFLKPLCPLCFFAFFGGFTLWKYVFLGLVIETNGVSYCRSFFVFQRHVEVYHLNVNLQCRFYSSYGSVFLYGQSLFKLCLCCAFFATSFSRLAGVYDIFVPTATDIVSFPCSR